MRLLVTGGAGFIGSHLVRRLLRKGHHVTIVDNLATGLRGNVPQGANLHELDLSRADFDRHLPRDGFDAIFHLAGQSSGEQSFEDPVYDFHTNARSTLLLTRWALRHEVRSFLFASSMAVYGATAPLPVAESAPGAPLSFYGASKLASEGILAVAAGQGLRTVIFRMFNVYGPGQNLENTRQGMISIYLDFLVRRQPLIVRGSLQRRRDFLYVDDAVRAWELAFEGEASGVFNLGTGEPTRVKELIAQMLMLYGCDYDYPVREEAGTPGDQEQVWADISRARRVLKWNPAVSLCDGLGRMIQWSKDSAGALNCGAVAN